MLELPRELVLPELEEVLEDEDEDEEPDDDLPDEPPLSASAGAALRARNRVALVARRAERIEVMVRFLEVVKGLLIRVIFSHA